LPRYTTDELIEVAKTLISQGHTRLKMVVAAGTDRTDEILGEPTDEDIVRDAERVRALREAVGPKIELMMDANKGATLAQALKLAKLCEPYAGIQYSAGDGGQLPAPEHASARRCAERRTRRVPLAGLEMR
jgi:L-alanine-DL-glutamate epimerase-like enolase superfamily enzyme